MKSKLACCVALFAVAAFVSTTMACPDKSAGSCGGDAKTASVKSEGCPIQKTVDAVLASFPKVAYRVGEETTSCSKSAGEMAEKSGKAMKYVVGGEVFDTQADADVKLASLIDEEIKGLQSVKFSVGSECTKCPITAKKMAKESGSKVAYRVAGVDFASKDEAEKAVTLVKAAVESVKMSYKVGEKSFSCDKMAGAEHDKSGKTMTFVVGDKETGCSQSAHGMMVKAKVSAAVKAAVTAHQL